MRIPKGGCSAMDPPEKMDCKANGEVILGVQGPSQPHLRENLLPAINMNLRSIITALRDHRTFLFWLNRTLSCWDDREFFALSSVLRNCGKVRQLSIVPQWFWFCRCARGVRKPAVFSCSVFLRINHYSCHASPLRTSWMRKRTPWLSVGLSQSMRVKTSSASLNRPSRQRQRP